MSAEPLPVALHLLPVPIADDTMAFVLPPSTLAVARALRHFVVEDARSARRALRDLGHPGPLQELDIRELPAAKGPASLAGPQLDELLAPLAQGLAVGVLSEAGCPGIADPGALLARWAQAHGHRVVPHVGPSSLLLALMGSGLEGQRFAFHGYLPVEAGERLRAIQGLEQRSARERATQLFIETPYRNQALLQALLEGLRGDTLLTLACDLTGAGEVLRTRPVREWRAQPREWPKLPTVFALLALSAPSAAKPRRG